MHEAATKLIIGFVRAARVTGSPRPSFRIDPRAAQRAPPPSPKPAAPGPVAPPPAPGPRSPAPPPRSRPRWLVPALVVAAIVVVAGLGYGGYRFVQDGTYPTKYLLKESEMPKGVRLSDNALDSMREDVDVDENPGEVGPDGMDDLTLPDGTRPEEAWAQGLDTPNGDGGRILVLAMRFGSTDDADRYVRSLSQACSFGSQSAVLQDDDVVLLVAAKDPSEAGYKSRVVTALKAKASGLRAICGA